MGVDSEGFLQLVAQLEGVELLDRGRYTQLVVHSHGFGYLWLPTQTVGLKQPLSEQLALVSERPDVFEVQFTAGAFGWGVVHLARPIADRVAETTVDELEIIANQIGARVGMVRMMSMMRAHLAGR